MGALLVCGLLNLLWAAAAYGQSMGQEIPLTNNDVEELVNAHNFFRGSVEPPATNMKSLIWNRELAQAALNFSLLCRLASNLERASQVPAFDTVGEVWSAIGTRSRPNYTAVVNIAWFNQRSMYSFESNTCSTENACLFYTQLVWADTTAVGCGAARCPRIPNFPVSDSVLLVCYYGPEGNTPGMRPYLVGEPCSMCPDGLTNCINRTCTATASSTAVPPASSTVTSTTASPAASSDSGLEGSKSKSSSSSNSSKRRKRSALNSEESAVYIYSQSN